MTDVSDPTYFTWQHRFFAGPRNDERPHPVVIVGAGPVGLALALNLAKLGIEVVLLEASDTVSTGSRALSLKRQTMRMLDRLGVGEEFLRLSLTWDRNTVFYGTRELFDIRLPNSPQEKHAYNTNLQQCWIEELLVREIEKYDNIQIRWSHRVAGIDNGESGVRLRVSSPSGTYNLDAEYAVAADGASGPVRRLLQLELKGTNFAKQYIVVDLEMASEHESGRRLWFDPPYLPGGTVVMHKSPFNVWRLDYQLPASADSDFEISYDRVVERVRAHLAMIGEKAPWKIVWISKYQPRTCTLESYRYGRCFFVGDAAHQIPIFGGRGLNHGFSDAGNLAWKLAYRLKGLAADRLLDSYTDERRAALVDSIDELEKAAVYLTAPTPAIKLMRDAVLSLALSEKSVHHLFDPYNTRLFRYSESRLNTIAIDEFNSGPIPGELGPEATFRAPGGGFQYLSDFRQNGFTAFYFANEGALEKRAAEILQNLAKHPASVHPVVISRSNGHADNRFARVIDTKGELFERYGASDGTLYLLRPDDYVAARWRNLDSANANAAVDRAVMRATQ